VRAAGETVAAIIAGGIIPAALEFMDRRCIATVEAFCAPGYPPDAEAILIAEIDGVPAEVEDDARRIEKIARGLGATEVRACDMLCMDGTIPRRALPDVLDRISALSDEYGLVCCNVFHAGDGNLHPLIVFDCMRTGELERAEAFGADILKLCVAVGGVLTGEHGVGVEKKGLMGEMFSDADLAQQEKLKCAFDGMGLLNPGKVFPTLHACVELGRMHVHDGRMPFGNLPRM
jgi:glycolate oxidase